METKGGELISELKGEYRFLSNFWSCFIEYDGNLYPSLEAAYQAAKCANYDDRKYFMTAKASDAKRRGKVVEMQPNWETIKVEIMLQLLRQKFHQEPLRTMLLDTGTQEIQEGNWWGDTFWGTCNGYGANQLGKLLMQVREELKSEQ